MLSVATRYGLAADPALPARDILLDADAVRERLTRSLGVDGQLALDTCTLVRAKYRIGESLRVVYRLGLADGQHLVSARAFTSGKSGPAHARACARVVATGDLRPTLHDAPLDTVWWTFPNDRRLRDAASLLRPTARLAASVGAPSWCDSSVVEYAPERSVTLQATDHAGSTVAYAKSYAPETGVASRLALRYRWLASTLASRPMQVNAPTSLGWSDERQLLLLQPMPGVRWSDLESARMGPALVRLGQAIAALHLTDAETSGLARFTRLDVRRLVHSAELVSTARPDVAHQATRLAHRLASGPPSGELDVVLHGDCHPKNALVDGDDIALIDLDQAGVGSAAADLGSLLARLRYSTLAGELSAGDAAGLGAGFLAGYASVRPLPPGATLRWHTAAALLAERAMRAVNRLNVAGLGQLGGLLGAAEDELRTGATT